MKPLRLFVGLSLLWLGWGFGCAQGDRAFVREGQEVIRTYPYGEADPVPIMTRSGMWGKGARLYPYTFFDEYSKAPVDRPWKVVRLENSFIEVAVLPEVGGKIWGATEKSTGLEFIYTNHALKFREIALRGPWTSGGIEFNFGIVGHTPSGAHPVDYLVQELPDGGVRCVVGNLDLPSRTRWSVAITVPPDRAYFETRALWINPSPLHQAYYVWMNSSARASKDLQFVFPGRRHIAHNFDVPLRPWPVDEHGRDLSWYRNNDFGSYKSYFTVGEYAESFGGYWHNDSFGFGHWARYDDMPGHKTWIWGLSRQGMIWEGLLTDTDGQYTEPQAGRYLNQNDHELFAPFSGDSWREIWFPYKEIGPMVRADPTGVLNVEQEPEALIVSICPLQYLSEELVVRDEARNVELHREALHLSPMEPAVRTIPVDPPPARFTVRIGSGLTYDSDPGCDDLQRPLRFHNPSRDSTEGIFLSAGRLERERSYYQALESYLEVINRDPRHIRALCRAAELMHRRGEHDRALKTISRALNISMYDPEANYIYAILARERGDLLDARETLGWAARSLAFRAAAFCQLGEIHMLEDRIGDALEYAGRALEYDTRNLNALHVRAAALRRSGRDREAGKTLEEILELDPLNHRARHMLSLLRPSPLAEKEFRSLIRSEFPHETYLELALAHDRLGMREEALDALRQAPNHPLVRYWKAWLLRETDPAAAALELQEAGKMSPLRVFPFRSETIPVFRWALEQVPEDWKPQYYLGLIFWGKERREAAWKMFEGCGNPDFAPLSIIRGYFLEEKDPDQALTEYARAVALEPDAWRYHHRLLVFLNSRGEAVEALASANEAVKRFPDSVPLRVEKVRALMLNRDYAAAARILDAIEALPSEGATALHGLYVNCYLGLGAAAAREGRLEEAAAAFQTAKLYPERLGSGAPYSPDVRLQDYLTALCYDLLGRDEEARILREAVQKDTLAHGSEKRTHDYIGGLVLREQGLREKAEELMRKTRPEQEILELIRRLKKGARP